MLSEPWNLFGGKEKMSTFAIPNENGVAVKAASSFKTTDAWISSEKFFEKSFKKFAD